jgi:hypothetical protein
MTLWYVIYGVAVSDLPGASDRKFGVVVRCDHPVPWLARNTTVLARSDWGRVRLVWFAEIAGAMFEFDAPEWQAARGFYDWYDNDGTRLDAPAIESEEPA